jgi:hypothetical protein
VREGRRKEELRDEANPGLPNILLVVTPKMKDKYRRFGQAVGFDLTFSVVKERTKDNGEYMFGLFASNNTTFKKIVIFGLVVTNSQSIFAYAFLFRQFFSIMGSVPEVIITDE